MLFLATAVAVLSAVPALAQNGQVFDAAAQLAAYSNTLPRDNAKQCFNGKFISGVNRSGQNTLYVQAPKGDIYSLRMADDCSALDAARKLTVRSNGSDIVCSGDQAETIALTSAGSQRCEVDSVRRLNAREAAALSTATRR
jgi:hypothetical protein